MNEQTQKPRVSVVGAGLAGSECALQLAHRGIEVDLYEMRPSISTPAHKTDQMAELVCSNSFGNLNEETAPGYLKFEAESLDSHILRIAKQYSVPAGAALGVDRELFARSVTSEIENHPLIRVHKQLITGLDQVQRPTIIATGPLTDPALATSLQEHFGNDFLYFFDAIAPIVDADSIDMEIAWRADRYNKGSADYINCPFDKEQYESFIDAVLSARKIEPKDFEKTPFFEGCMPIEVMVERGRETPRFGPMKPVGLVNPKTGKEAHAVLQLRQENREATSYNLVGFQTRMAYSEQIRVFRMIPGLQNAEFLKLGSIHRNLFINSPKVLLPNLSSRKDPSLFFAGQITGVEGYFESTCIGILVSRFVESSLTNKTFNPPPRESAMGSLLDAITNPERAEHFQPTNINFGLFPSIAGRFRDKQSKKKAQLERARLAFQSWLEESTDKSRLPKMTERPLDL